MTVVDTNAMPTAKPLSLIQRIGVLLTAYGEMRSRRDKIMRLNALSDEELARRGLDRDDIVAHVFADKLYL